MLDTGKRVHIRGAQEADVCSSALLLHHRGLQVSASAGERNSAVEALEEAGIDVKMGIEPELVAQADLVLRSAQISVDDPELAAARDHGIEIVDVVEVLSELTSGYRTIAVTGTHGRGTVSSMVAWILDCAGREPGFVLSARHNNFDMRARDAGGNWFVLELDESLIGQGLIECDYALCSFLEFDATAGDEDWRALMTSIRSFWESNRRLKEAFVNLDCLGNRQLVDGLALRPTGYSLEHRAEFRGELGEPTEKGLSFAAAHRDRGLGDFTLGIPGSYNAVNALGAIAVAHRLGIALPVIADALATYEGLENRYAVARGGGITVVKDLADDPPAMSNVVDTAKQELEGRLYCVMEGRDIESDRLVPDAMAEALSECDVVVAHADETTASESLRNMGDALRTRDVDFHILREDESQDYLQRQMKTGDKVIFFGDDAFLRQADHLRAALASKAAQVPAEDEQPRLDGPLINGED